MSGRVYLPSGQIDEAEAHFATVVASARVRAGTRPARVLRGLVEEDANYVVR